MKSAQRKMESALATGDVSEAAKNAYLAQVKRYFAGFEREARVHLRNLDKRLEHVNQVHFNLSAERGAAVKRIEVTQAVLQDIDRVAGA
ncbi:MAG TPA: hypothetical protein VFL13_06025 [Candidatus Baltobacteraceae bacterium]|nr:hypothetical protein [Candidatus Baltobacteraceae bacterium]